MMVSTETLQEALAMSRAKGKIVIGVVGCVDYTFASDGNIRHQTPFVFQILMAKGGLVELGATPVPASALIVRAPTLGTARQPT